MPWKTAICRCQEVKDLEQRFCQFLSQSWKCLFAFVCESLCAITCLKKRINLLYLPPPHVPCTSPYLFIHSLVYLAKIYPGALRWWIYHSLLMRNTGITFIKILYLSHIIWSCLCSLCVIHCPGLFVYSHCFKT